MVTVVAGQESKAPQYHCPLPQAQTIHADKKSDAFVDLAQMTTLLTMYYKFIKTQ